MPSRASWRRGVDWSPATEVVSHPPRRDHDLIASLLDLGSWHLAEPAALAAFVLLPLPWLAARRRRRLAWPTLEGFRDAPKGRAGVIRHLPDLLLALGIASLAVALARPRAVGGQTRVSKARGAIVTPRFSGATQCGAEK